MGSRHVAVVGASLAGLRTVEGLRRLGHDGPITLIGDEPELPYDRPPLSKDVLLGKAGPADVALTTAADLAALEVDLRLGAAAHGLDLARRTVLVGDDRVGFDDLVIATGAAARRPNDLPHLDGIHLLRSLADAAALRSAFELDPRVVVLGGGFVGAEVASSARDLGLDVTVVDVAPVLMERGLGAVLGARMTRIAADAGVRLRLGTSIATVHGTDRVEAATLSDGTVLPTDLLVIGIGATPNTTWLDGSGLTVADGVVCDAFLAAAPGVYAVGDVARWTHPGYQRSIRCENWTSAGEHADAVAATLTGNPVAADAIPYVWSDQFGHKVQVAGLPEPKDEVRPVLDTSEKFVAVAGSRGAQSSAFALNAPGALVRQRIKLAARPPWPPEME
ncbi:3-phenylpropionate/trans-cinnamate dioxygenase ferredoxin reductase subunit [Nocardioides ginsengisegetis]|uniref:3-phenylpropionate/trans-cinnamate dioxygenase ferredoxin reductase subunit n=1 Tax=Nocardioides ginsengisegetis TaxID=661491 RepID=A0A7W3PAY2_9ACTN|nr:3-phenylpropionate/trans-cinnamate dioxygenase ferredoxin reductase subunit [Nocardioides ginsengisegetis]